MLAWGKVLFTSDHLGQLICTCLTQFSCYRGICGFNKTPAADDDSGGDDGFGDDDDDGVGDDEYDTDDDNDDDCVADR